MNEAEMILRLRYHELARALSDIESGITKGDRSSVISKLAEIEKAVSWLVEMKNKNTQQLIKKFKN
jgi:hypothetical protein